MCRWLMWILKQLLAVTSNEIRLLERLSGHSRIVKLYICEVNQQNGFIQIILECGELDMNTLLAKLQRKPINLNFIQMYWEQILEAVHAIHQQKIAHSDLKPANFILGQGALKLIDFGIAKAIPNDATSRHFKLYVSRSYKGFSWWLT
ncbi:kinase-like domain-containing protein [Umbelopsis sp. PMI_123]|nr:kinase-like domain-containing protein [Umbelopsis sp. PMI_123]